MIGYVNENTGSIFFTARYFVNENKGIGDLSMFVGCQKRMLERVLNECLGLL